MESDIKVTSLATNRLLVTLAQVKTELGITDTASDPLLEIIRARVSERVTQYCGREFARDTVEQTFTCVRGAEHLLLGHAFPNLLPPTGYCTVASAVVDGVELGDDDYVVDPRSGLLGRRIGGEAGKWWANKIVVTFTAGYVLPDDSNPTLPLVIRGAAVELIKDGKFTSARDATVKSKSVLSGLTSTTFFDPRDDGSPWPAGVTTALNDYRNRVFG